MKRLLLFGPILWLRKVVLYLLVIFVVLGIVIYFVSNSPLVIKKVVDSFAPDYNITYSRIHGNAMTGIEIEDLRYANQPIGEHVALKWNPSGLLKEEIIVNKIEIRKANIDTIKVFIDSFPTSDENESSEAFFFDVKVHHANISLAPFVEHNITFNAVVLEANELYYSSEEIEVKSLKLKIDTNISKLTLNAGLDGGIVNVKTLTLSEVDTVALQTLFSTDENQSTTPENNQTQDSQNNPLIPKIVNVEKLEIDVLPRTFEPLQIKALSLSVNDALFDVPTLVLQHAKVALNGNTNLSDITYDAEVKENEIMGTLKLVPMDELFTLYDLPVRKESIGDIFIDLNASKDKVLAKLNTQMKQLLKAEKDVFNLDIDNLHSTVVYDIAKGVMEADSKAIVTTPYAENISVSNLFILDENISYSGEVSAKQIIGIDAKFTKVLNDLHVKYVGDIESIKTDIKSQNLKGTFISNDFKKALVHLETLKAIQVSELVELPIELNQTKVNLVIDAPISFDANSSLSAHAKISSNVVNIDANVSYKDMLEIKSVIDIPKTSLLRPYSKELKWDNLSPMKVDATLLDNTIDATLESDALNAKIHYMLDSTKVDGHITLAGLKADISGIVEEKMSIKTNISSIPSLIESVQGIYTLADVPAVKGSANVTFVVSQMKEANLTLTSPRIVYRPDHKIEHEIDNINLQVRMTESEIELSRYSLTYVKQKVFATKPSRVLLKDDVVRISELWVNDELKVVGEYSLKTKQGTINTEANKLHIAHEIIDLDSKVDIKTVLDGNTTSVKGKIILLGGDIHYDMSQKSFASDSDIIIVQDIKPKQDSPFMDNLSVDIQIQTKKPLVYNKGNINMKANVDLGVHKAELSELMVLGTVELEKGGSYIFEDKKFVLGESFVHFTGNPNKLLLEVTVNYKSLNHFITILITGSADMPNINFSSKPSLTKEQILSIILFDSEGGAGTNSGEDMMKMMGGAMAKSALKDLGVKLDHLVLGSGNSVEVGKKLTDDITIIYVNDIVSSVKLKYEHSRRMESVISAGEESQSYDIIYKRDFKAIGW